MAVPLDLRVVCRRLALTSAEKLPAVTSTLVRHIIRCRDVLSAGHDGKGKSNSALEATQLVHKLKTHINTLLNGRSPAGRFTAVVLVKTVIDVSGWEGLRGSATWVRGLLSILNKPDAIAVKELCIVALARIYTLLQPYQTLVREIATPTLPDFAKACLQLAQPAASNQALKTPLPVLETIANALHEIIPLYPTTLRTFAPQLRVTFRPYIAPTASDQAVISTSMRHASRRLIISLHHVSPGNGGAEEWATFVDEVIKACHRTADLTFRAVREYWESTTGYRPGSVDQAAEPHGGAATQSDLPAWSGVSSGADRIVGLVETLTDCLSCSTRTPVVTSLDNVLDLCSRLTSVMPPKSSSRDGVDDLNFNPNVGREEREELWSCLPSVHLAVVNLLNILLRRFGNSLLPLLNDILGMTTQIFDSAASQDPEAREQVYLLVAELLPLAGSALPKNAVASLKPIIKSACNDLLLALESVAEDNSTTRAAVNGSKASSSAMSADSILPSEKQSFVATSRPIVQRGHIAAAQQLLPVLFSHLPQHHLSQEQRKQLDQAAIITRNKDAMLASCLHPYKHRSGHLLASILPFLNQEFPNDQRVEILRSNLIRSQSGDGVDDDYASNDTDSHAAIPEIEMERPLEQSLEKVDGPASRAVAPEEVAMPIHKSWAVEWPRTSRPDAVMQSEHRDVVSEQQEPRRTSPQNTTSNDALSMPLSDVNPLKRRAEEADDVDGAGVDNRVDWDRTVKKVSKDMTRSDSSDDSDIEDTKLDMTLDLDEESSDGEE